MARVKIIAGMAGVLAVSLFTTSVYASAADGFYGKVGVGWTHFYASKNDTVVNASSVRKNDIGWSVGGGYQWNQNFGLEANYTDWGSYKYKSDTASADGKIQSKTIDAMIVGIFPMSQNFSANLKGGAYYNFVNKSRGLGLDNDRTVKSQAGFVYAVGAQYNFTPNVGIGIEWKQLTRRPFESMLGANFVYNFG